MQAENLAKEQLAKEREKLQAKKGGQASSRARPHFILIDKTESAIAFDVVLGSKWERTILLSARAPRHLRRLDSPPPVTAE